MSPEMDGPLPELPAPEVRRQLREKMGISVTGAARELGISRNSYYYWECGTRQPRAAHHRAYYSQLNRWQQAIDSVE